MLQTSVWRCVTVLALSGSVLGARLEAQACPVPAGDSAAVRDVATGIIEADNARDLVRVLGYYAPDATLHPPGESPVSGRDQIRPRYQGLFAQYDPAIVLEIGAVDLCGDLAVVSGRNTGVLRGRGGAADRRLGDAFVMVLRRAGREWSITRLIWHPDGG